MFVYCLMGHLLLTLKLYFDVIVDKIIIAQKNVF